MLEQVFRFLPGFNVKQEINSSIFPGISGLFCISIFHYNFDVADVEPFRGCHHG